MGNRKNDGFLWGQDGEQRWKERRFSTKEGKVSKKSPFCTFATGLESGSELQLLLCDTGNLLSAALWIPPEGLFPHTVRQISQVVGHPLWNCSENQCGLNPATGCLTISPGSRFRQSLNWKKTLHWKGISNPHATSPLAFNLGAPVDLLNALLHSSISLTTQCLMDEEQEGFDTDRLASVPLTSSQGPPWTWASLRVQWGSCNAYDLLGGNTYALLNRVCGLENTTEVTLLKAGLGLPPFIVLFLMLQSGFYSPWSWKHAQR